MRQDRRLTGDPPMVIGYKLCHTFARTAATRLHTRPAAVRTTPATFRPARCARLGTLQSYVNQVVAALTPADEELPEHQGVLDSRRTPRHVEPPPTSGQQKSPPIPEEGGEQYGQRTRYVEIAGTAEPAATTSELPSVEGYRDSDVVSVRKSSPLESHSSGSL
jgi:hypothetical protein